MTLVVVKIVTLSKRGVVSYKITVVQRCPTFCSLRAKFLIESLSRAAITETIKVMSSCEFVQKFPSSKEVFSKKKSRLLYNFRSQNYVFFKKKKCLICLWILFCR